MIERFMEGFADWFVVLFTIGFVLAVAAYKLGFHVLILNALLSFL